ncbi:N-acetylmuramic acid 6-phosphate etherase [Gluconobacter roseus]|uniref:N-acetylmuramic acid 6-phosphate etherase n=1 Tax=Gluconobacter roseus NBRC 3990 TaxID=1307950 RepID=A0A4Y3M8H5_9PROT|nr:N-acetylmuramic acid 6-phosphate etherase [Gluconobacter roseus]KXV44905.1 N-acetylmuramic acid-6-phosphate etherase [Gluconobacter roseus]GBR46216.1 N-acetylmuramic acid 6-phosphate etherase [Gluconobacter roseus NBRC 3990]GEB04845.1 N-acetylmuramic acid 6-phosphate etherase [Gluconobacter roseus NBRC 3990]GLP94609.1 N-acetylmuramic acid 6-phosphate etherase [Gluconobacter roseus NBRC 3990]
MTATNTIQTSSTAPTGTEQQDPRYGDIDLWLAISVLDALAEAQMTATAVARAAIPQMNDVITAALPRLRAGGRLFYVGAGTSGRVGLQDGVELTPTFGWPSERLVLMLPGGTTALFEAVEGAEDREETACTEILSHNPGPDDVVFGIAASGATPYTCAAIAAARNTGALTVGISCNKDGRLLREAELGIAIVTGPEVIAGSTRLKAGTAQKAVLNMLSTTLMIQLGHGYRGQMVDMRVVNAKLEKRAARMVHDLAGGTSEEIEAALQASHQNVKRAILIRAGLTAEEAETALAQHAGDLRAVMAAQTDRG